MDGWTLAEDVHITTSAFVAMTCWVWYDYLLTLPDEIQFVWRRRLTLPRALFALSRISGLVLTTTMTAVTLSPLTEKSQMLDAVSAERSSPSHFLYPCGRPTSVESCSPICA
ncbi:hypothetical protein CALVIDRAFT_120680 [Calocera viscosa TUFC12733]|uniref:DUF6533 domain-containing protein n=1 Tax=Calocera viscosa (strain TUFC12733) TaxID=1330018 RepID=A0A167MAI7_CALVF|nr:hypothetical protein CALVIDRAFT_120680 [Calocera viscosa TUFC12733]